MDSKEQIRALNELFGWVKVELTDEDGKSHEHRIKYSLGSMYDIAEAKIDLTDKTQLEKPDVLARVIHYGLPLKVQKEITPREIAYQIDLEKLMDAVDQVSRAIEDGNPGALQTKDEQEQESSSGSSSKKK